MEGRTRSASRLGEGELWFEARRRVEEKIWRFARTPPPSSCRISDSRWHTQVAAAARLMVADGCGLRQRLEHAEDDEGELWFEARRRVEEKIWRFARTPRRPAAGFLTAAGARR